MIFHISCDLSLSSIINAMIWRSASIRNEYSISSRIYKTVSDYGESPRRESKGDKLGGNISLSLIIWERLGECQSRN